MSSGTSGQRFGSENCLGYSLSKWEHFPDVEFEVQNSFLPVAKRDVQSASARCAQGVAHQTSPGVVSGFSLLKSSRVREDTLFELQLSCIFEYNAPLLADPKRPGLLNKPPRNYAPAAPHVPSFSASPSVSRGPLHPVSADDADAPPEVRGMKGRNTCRNGSRRVSGIKDTQLEKKKRFFYTLDPQHCQTSVVSDDDAPFNSWRVPAITEIFSPSLRPVTVNETKAAHHATTASQRYSGDEHFKSPGRGMLPLRYAKGAARAHNGLIFLESSVIRKNRQHQLLQERSQEAPEGHCCARCRNACNVWELCQPVRCFVDQNEIEIIPGGSHHPTPDVSQLHRRDKQRHQTTKKTRRRKRT